jgi:hypothetical protein
MSLLGQNVIYTDTRGHAKVAIVTGTRDSVKASTSLPRPQEGFAHLHVFSHKQGLYARLSVPARAVVIESQDYSAGGYFETVQDWTERTELEAGFQAALDANPDLADGVEPDDSY